MTGVAPNGPATALTRERAAAPKLARKPWRRRAPTRRARCRRAQTVPRVVAPQRLARNFPDLSEGPRTRQAMVSQSARRPLAVRWARNRSAVPTKNSPSWAARSVQGSVREVLQPLGSPQPVAQPAAHRMGMANLAATRSVPPWFHRHRYRRLLPARVRPETNWAIAHSAAQRAAQPAPGRRRR